MKNDLVEVEGVCNHRPIKTAERNQECVPIEGRIIAN